MEFSIEFRFEALFEVRLQAPCKLPYESLLKLPLEQHWEQQQPEQHWEQQHWEQHWEQQSSQFSSSPSASFPALFCFASRASSFAAIPDSAPASFSTSPFDRELSFSVSTISFAKQRTRFSRAYWYNASTAPSLRAFPTRHPRGERAPDKSKTRTSEKLKRRNTSSTTSSASEQSATHVSTVSTLQREKLQAKRRRTQPPIAVAFYRGFRRAAQRVRHEERVLVVETPASGPDLCEIRGNPADSRAVAAVIDVQNREICARIVETEVPSRARRFREVGKAMRNCCSMEYAIETSNSKRPSTLTTQRNRLKATLRAPERPIREQNRQRVRPIPAVINRPHLRIAEQQRNQPRRVRRFPVSTVRCD